MKKKFTLLLILFCLTVKLNSQNIFYEGFTAPFDFTGKGWHKKNLSSPMGVINWWYTGIPSVFNANSGVPQDYIATNYNSTSGVGTNNTISNWLITPTLTLANGGVIEFYARSGGVRPDRLQLYISTSGVSIDVGTTVGTATNTAGTFTTILLDINPTQILSGFPVSSWAKYTATLSGIPAPTSGRAAFRYYVTKGGNQGVNSSYIGIDDFKYTLNCDVMLQSYTVCPGLSTTLTAMSTVTNNTYTWSPVVSSSASVVVTPTASTIYTLTNANGSVTCPSQTVEVTVGANLSIGLSASSTSACSNSTVSIVASGAASSYTWSTGSTASVITPTVNGTTTYSVIGSNGACTGTNNITISSLPIPTLSASMDATVVCPNSMVGGSAIGVLTYTWAIPQTTLAPVAGNPFYVFTDNSDQGKTYTITVFGTDLNGCTTATSSLTIYVPFNPTVNVGATNTVVCVNESVTITATGAQDYYWYGKTTSTVNPYVYTPTTVGVDSFYVDGADANGCWGTDSIKITISACIGIKEIDGTYSNINLFPNPFNSEITITEFEGSIAIYNALGELVFRQDNNLSGKISTSNLISGIYFVKLLGEGDNKQRTYKLLKQ